MRSKLHGFTLLEILIALFIFTVLSIIMTSALHSVTQTQTTVDQHAERLAELQMAMLAISRDLEQTIDRPTTNMNGLEPAFIGSPNSITFTHSGLTNPLAQLRRSNLRRVQYFVKKGKLIRQVWPMLDQNGKLTPPNQTLITNVSRIQFGFLDSQKKFIPSWPPPNKPQVGLPRAVRVIIIFPDMGKVSQLYTLPLDVDKTLETNLNGMNPREIIK